MRKKGIIVIIVLIMLTAFIIGAYAMTNNVSYQNITMNGITMEVPKENMTPQIVTENYTKYIDEKSSIEIYTYDSENENDTNNSEIKEFNSKLESFKDSKLIEKDNETYNKSKDNHYFYHAKNKNKNILVITDNEEKLLHVLKHMEITDMATSNPLNKTQNDTSDKTKSTTGAKKSSSSKDSGVYWDDEYNTYFDKNDKTVYDGQFKKGTSKKEMKQAFDEIERETNI